jgi:hypothetical protein
MPADRIAMRQVRDVFRLTQAGISAREIAVRIGVAPSTVRLTLKRLADAGLSWPLPEGLSDEALEARLFTTVGTKQGHRRQAEPDWAELHHQMKRKHVTLSILWDEYIERHPDGYRYSRFCDLYRGFERTLSVTMRQTHAAGDKLFVDYVGDMVPVIVDRRTGRFGRPRSSSPSWEHRTSPTWRRPGPRPWPIGSAAMFGLSRQSVACPIFWFRTIPRSR